MEQLKPTDYSQKTNWYKIPEITKEFDTFYIYSTIFMGANEGDPDYATLDNAEMLAGYSITKDDLEANPHMKFATGESDTGVIISWHAEGPKNVEANIPIPSVIIAKNGIAINPLNWKRDETYAPASENFGSIVGDEKTGKTEIRDIDGDAQVCIARGTVVTNAKATPNEMTELAGPQCYHQDDYSIFYNNIKDNVAKRIAAYKASR